MPKAALFALLVALFLSPSAQGQRAGASFHGGAVRSPVRGGSLARHNSTRLSSRTPAGRRRFDPLGSSFLPYSDLLADQQPESDAAANGPMPPTVIPPAPEPALRQPQFIEIPSVANAAPGKLPPPTVFVLANGERLETRRFVLSASALSVSLDRQQRTLPLDVLDLNATISANHERGIDLRIPYDRNEISLSF